MAVALLWVVHSAQTHLLWPIAESEWTLWGGIGATLPVGGNADGAPVDVRILQQRAFEATRLNRGRVDEYLFAVDCAAALGRVHFDYRSRSWGVEGNAVLSLTDAPDQAQFSTRPFVEFRLDPLVAGAAVVWNIDEPGRQYPWGAMVWFESRFGGE
jgi:hypothetical protein